MLDRRHRGLGALRGAPSETASRALALTRGARHGLWVGAAPAGWPFAVCDPRGLRAHLGRDVDAVVLDDPDPETLGRAHGCVRGGGRLILRLSPTATPSRWRRRLEAAIERAGGGALEGPLTPWTEPLTSTAEQGAAVALLRRLFEGPGGAVVSLVADRGRGKSTALGLALRGLERPVVLTGPGEGAVEAVRRQRPTLPFTPLRELLDGRLEPEVIVIDEAAQIPVARLRTLMLRHPRARVAFASTTRGYEGTGRGFVLRFLTWLQAHQRARGCPFAAPTLDAPIRWAADDPVERFVFDALLLDARPSHFTVGEDLGPIAVTALDRDRLARDEALLRAVFGLLVHAHYRTTPRDLALLLDDPALRINAVLVGERVAAVNLLVAEGGLDPTLADALYRGRANVRGQALPHTLAADCGRPEAARWPMLRSMRIATHSALRRRGLARRLVEAAHADLDHEVELVGTVFGATAPLLRFRQRLGYRLVRLGVSGGRRAGEPAAVMLRPLSDRAAALVEALTQDLAEGLPRQLELMLGDQTVEQTLARAVRVHLPAPPPPDPERRDAAVAAYAFGPRTFESAAHALYAFVHGHRARLPELDALDAALIRQRVLEGRSWRAVGADIGGVRAAMRRLRRALRAFVARVDPQLEARCWRAADDAPESTPARAAGTSGPTKGEGGDDA